MYAQRHKILGKASCLRSYQEETLDLGEKDGGGYSRSGKEHLWGVQSGQWGQRQLGEGLVWTSLSRNEIGFPCCGSQEH